MNTFFQFIAMFFYSKNKVRKNPSFRYYKVFKCLADRAIALAALIICFPLLLVVSILIQLLIGSPIFFLQERAGYLGKPFWIIKFRTMQNTKDSSNRFIQDSDRLTTFGKLLRKFSIDELPELINIIRGEMSFIGPRPLIIQYLPFYSKQEAKRHNVIPGISGWAQINGRNAISWEKKFDLDLWYVENQSFWLDLRIFIVTFIKVIHPSGVQASDNITMPSLKDLRYKGDE